ncbi:MAG: hypothetical protein R3B68_13480 [Phycisphaerales bacterium]
MERSGLLSGRVLRSPEPEEGAIPGAFSDEPIPVDDGRDPSEMHIVPVSKVPNRLRPKDEEEAPTPEAAAAGSKIRAFEQRMSGRHEDKGWARTPNSPGTGAIHVRSFHCKMNTESLEYLDQQINEWLDEHPQYEVKFVQTAVGEWTGKTKEPNLVVQVWV